MRKLPAILLVLGLTGLLFAAPFDSDKIFPYPYRIVQLENGFKAYLIDTGPSGQIAYVTVVRTGSREEWEPGRSGYAHFFEHMMFRGTPKYPDYSAITIKLGASRNAFTSDDLTCYYMVTAGDALEQVMDLESDRFQNLNYSEADFKRQAVPVLGEFNQGRANPTRYLLEKLQDTAFTVHTYKHTTIGFEEDVRAMPEGFEYSRSFFQRYYRPENCVLLLSGEFDFDQAEQMIHKYYDAWKPGYVAPEIKPEPAQTAPKNDIVTFPGRTLPTLAVAYKGPAWSATDKLAVATEVLGRIAFGDNSDLYKKLVIKEQRAEDLYGEFSLQRDPFLLVIGAEANNTDDLQYIEGEIAATVAKFRDEPCSAKLLADTKSAMKYRFLDGMETAQGTAFSLLTYVTNTGSIEPVEDYYRTLAALSPEDIMQAAKTYLVDSGRTTVTLLSAEAKQ